MVTYPVVTYLGSCPVSAYEFSEAFGTAALTRQAGDIYVTRFGLSAVRGGCGLVNDHQGSGVSQFHFGRLNGVSTNFSYFMPAMAFVSGAGKKGVFVPSSFSAVFIGARRASLLCLK